MYIIFAELAGKVKTVINGSPEEQPGAEGAGVQNNLTGFFRTDSVTDGTVSSHSG